MLKRQLQKVRLASKTKSPANVRDLTIDHGASFFKLEATRLHSSDTCDSLRADAQEGFGLGHFGVPFAQLLGCQKVYKPLAGSATN